MHPQGTSPSSESEASDFITGVIRIPDVWALWGDSLSATSFLKPTIAGGIFL